MLQKREGVIIPNQYLLKSGIYIFYTNVYSVLGSVTDHGEKMKHVHCSPKQVMVIKSANYGDYIKNSIFSNDEKFDATCSVVATCQVKSRCNGKRSCELTMNSDLLPSQYCSDTSKQIYTKYYCKDSYDSSTKITSGKVNAN